MSSFTKIFEEDKLQQGAAPAGPEKIIHSIKAAIAANPEGTAVLLSDISNAYNERESELRCLTCSTGGKNSIIYGDVQT